MNNSYVHRYNYCQWRIYGGAVDRVLGYFSSLLADNNIYTLSGV